MDPATTTVATTSSQKAIRTASTTNEISNQQQTTDQLEKFNHQQAMVENNDASSPMVTNPQDGAVSKPASTSSLSLSQKDENNIKTEKSKSTKIANTISIKQRKKKRRGRYVRVAVVNDSTNDSDGIYPTNDKTTKTAKTNKSNKKLMSSFPPLPGNQYETIIRRRAVRKRLDDDNNRGIQNTQQQTTTTSSSSSSSKNRYNEEEYGDISLGMKLIVVSGRVIVQAVTPLSDGRASPAQLAGVIQRGDVLMSIDNLSLVTLPLGYLMSGLNPLSTPNANGYYQRTLRLRFEAGAGMELLKKHEEGQQWKSFAHRATSERRESLDAANDMFSLFPMVQVDQLSPAPLYEERRTISDGAVPPTKNDLSTIEEAKDSSNSKSTSRSNDNTTSPTVLAYSADDTLRAKQMIDVKISEALANVRISDRDRYTSEYFMWNENCSTILRARFDMDHAAEMAAEEELENGLTKSERFDRAKKIMAVAKGLSYTMEDIDKGKDMRSFRRWSSTISLRSRASSRRRFVLDSASLPPVHRSEIVETKEEDDSESGESVGSASMDGLDGDELLLRLAAHDEIWRRQVVEHLEQSIKDLDDKLDKVEEQQPKMEQDIDSALSKHLGAFLFGENMTRIVTKKKRSKALPPDEITVVLFDLTTNITSNAPDEITLLGAGSAAFSVPSSVIPVAKMRQQKNGDVALATRFVLDEALPLWLETFRPLPWDQRRVLWPRVKMSSTESHAGTSTVYSDDSITVDSGETKSRSPAIKQTKNLREIIEDQELDVEARAETCFLVTHFYIHKLLEDHYSPTKNDNNSNEDVKEPDDKEDSPLKDPVLFIKKYGAYLKLESCLSHAALIKAEPVIEQLLRVAKHDPFHRDALKEFAKGSTLTFYDPSKLSAVVKSLVGIRFETRAERRKLILNLCVSAYPDIQPWQVRKACLELPVDVDKGSKPCDQKTMDDLFYSYLSSLLDHMEGHDAARHDAELVKEWCELSIAPIVAQKEGKVSANRLQNFFDVASRNSSMYESYHRDLSMLLKLCMKIKEYDLALDLVGEMLDHRKYISIETNLTQIRDSLQVIALYSLEVVRNVSQATEGYRVLKRVLRHFHKMSHSKSSLCRQSISVPNEIHTLIQVWSKDINNPSQNPEALALIDFISAESDPSYILKALVLWADSHDLASQVFQRLHNILRRGVYLEMQSELSGSLLRLKHARSNLDFVVIPHQNDNAVGIVNKNDGIWKRMSAGQLAIDK